MLTDSKIIDYFIWQTTSALFYETIKEHPIEDGEKHRNKPS